MSFEYEREEISASPGRRNFNVLTHHSNRFGVVFTNDITLYSWNCTDGDQCRARRERRHPQFRVVSRRINFPFIYE